LTIYYWASNSSCCFLISSCQAIFYISAEAGDWDTGDSLLSRDWSSRNSSWRRRASFIRCS
jgi:hypothetical protein